MKHTRELAVICDNIRSLYNVGSILRTSDGFGVSRVYLCGITGTPEQKGVLKVSLGAENTVPWEKVSVAWRLVERLKKDGWQILALEQVAGSHDVSRLPAKFIGDKCAVIVGNEVNGVSPGLLSRADAAIEIPMLGKKESLNVAVACGVALYAVRYSK